MAVVKSEKPIEIPKDYFDKRIFRSAIVLLIILAVPAFFMDDFGTSLYFSCESEKGCINPCYDCYNQNPTVEPCSNKLLSLCNEYSDKSAPYIQSGESLGKAPSKYFRIFNYIVTLVIGLAFGLNHLFYKRRKGNEKN
jgi:hypothetical protein